MDENTRAGQNVGSAVSASDADSNTLRYSLEGPGKDSFTILSSSGQIRTRSPLDFETRKSYSVTVKVNDGQNRKNSVAAKSVTITVDNVTEQPSPPAAPRVSGIPGSTDSVRATWDAPANTGPRVKEYEVHYKESGSGLGFARWTHGVADRSTIITDLKAGTRYEVQVRARTDEGTSDWSRSGTGMPNPDVANRNPTFSGGSRTLSVAENTLPNTDVGAPRRGNRPRWRHADLHPGGGGRGVVRHLVNLRRRPDTHERGAEPRGEGEVLGNGPREGRQRRHRRGEHYDQCDGRQQRGAGHAVRADGDTGI